MTILLTSRNEYNSPWALNHVLPHRSVSYLQDLLNVSLKENVTEQEEQVLKEAHKRTPTEEEEEEQKIPLGKRAKFE